MNDTSKATVQDSRSLAESAWRGAGDLALFVSIPCLVLLTVLGAIAAFGGGLLGGAVARSAVLTSFGHSTPAAVLSLVVFLACVGLGVIAARFGVSFGFAVTHFAQETLRARTALSRGAGR